MQPPELIPHLFRTEFRKIAAVLCRQFGLDQVQTAEDIASETFLSALETWSYKGLPANPVAWLYTVARNKARNHLQRCQLYSKKIVPGLGQADHAEETEIDLSEENIRDSQLQMLFALCHPSIPAEAQVALSLRILCGFGIDEIANAFQVPKETIHKRLFRAREKLRQEKLSTALPPRSEIRQRLETVLRTIYLLFNEGYYSESNDDVIREDLCLEAIRLCKMLADHEMTDLPAVNALLALMCFHASRFRARKNALGELVLYDDQDESLWNPELVAEGAAYLHKASQGSSFSRFHLEAAIAYWHTQKSGTEKWKNILQLYDLLLQLEYSPMAALNRAYALSKTEGRMAAIREAEQLRLEENPYYFTLLGELHKGLDNGKARECYRKALMLAKTGPDKKLLSQKLASL